MQTGHLDIIHKLRNNADNIFGLPKSHFVTTCERLKVLTVVEMLGVKDTLNLTYSIWYPFLFKDMRVNMRKPFSNWKPFSQVRWFNVYKIHLHITCMFYRFWKWLCGDRRHWPMPMFNVVGQLPMARDGGSQRSPQDALHGLRRS